MFGFNPSSWVVVVVGKVLVNEERPSRAWFFLLGEKVFEFECGNLFIPASEPGLLADCSIWSHELSARYPKLQEIGVT